MPGLPVLSGEQVVRIFENFGWRVARRRGSHIILTKEGDMATLSVPNHQKILHLKGSEDTGYKKKLLNS